MAHLWCPGRGPAGRTPQGPAENSRKSPGWLLSNAPLISILFGHKKRTRTHVICYLASLRKGVDSTRRNSWEILRENAKRKDEIPNFFNP